MSVQRAHRREGVVRCTFAELCSAARDYVFKDANALAAGLHCTHVAFGVALTANEFRFVAAFVTTRVDLDEVSCPEELLAPELTLATLPSISARPHHA